LQLLQNPRQQNVENLNNIGRENSRTFRNKRREHLRVKINDLETNSKNKNIRCINEFNRGYQPRANGVKEQNGDVRADFHSTLNRRKN